MVRGARAAVGAQINVRCSVFDVRCSHCTSADPGLRSQDIPGTGRFAVIQDPQGVLIQVITYKFEG